MLKRVRTPDDWFPTRQDGTVEVKLIHLGRDPSGLSNISRATWRVWVSGEDDFAMVKDFPTEQESAARTLWESIADGISIAELEKQGFERF